MTTFCPNPKCRVKFGNRVRIHGELAPPRDGDFGVCWQCGTVWILACGAPRLAQDADLRRMTPESRLALARAAIAIRMRVRAKLPEAKA